MKKSWEEWVQENLERKCAPQGIAETLLKNKFPIARIREMMGEHFPENLSENTAVITRSPEPQPIVDAAQIHRKRECVVNMQRQLASMDPSRKAIERRSNLSRQEFLEQYYAVNRPVVLCGLMEGWKAPKKWAPQYLKDTCGEEMVEIMASRASNPLYEIDVEGHRQKVRFAEFVDMINEGGETNDYYMTARNNFFALPAARPMWDDFAHFPEYLKESAPGDGTFLWYGPKGTITPLHHDPMNIFMAQVQGRKLVKLVPAEELDLIYNHFAVYSLVDAGNPDYECFPEFKNATVIDVELAAGEVLFLPAGWWHYVKSLDASMTIAFNNFVFPNTFEWVHPRSY